MIFVRPALASSKHDQSRQQHDTSKKDRRQPLPQRSAATADTTTKDQKAHTALHREVVTPGPRMLQGLGLKVGRQGALRQRGPEEAARCSR